MISRDSLYHVRLSFNTLLDSSLVPEKSIKVHIAKKKKPVAQITTLFCPRFKERQTLKLLECGQNTFSKQQSHKSTPHPPYPPFVTLAIMMFMVLIVMDLRFTSSAVKFQ